MYGRSRDTSVWGRFDLRIQGRHMMLPLVARLLNWRSRLSGIAAGDQAMFVQRESFFRVGGFRDIPVMEDVESQPPAEGDLAADLRFVARHRAG